VSSGIGKSGSVGSTSVKIGNAQGFWGDRVDAAAELAQQQPDLDYLTLDYLAEVSMSILARQRIKRPELGYAGDFVDALRLLAPHWRERQGRHRLRVISNAGGLNPHGCAAACCEVLREAGCGDMRVAVVHGDDVLSLLKSAPRDQFRHLESGRPLSDVLEGITTANAYLGADGIVEALQLDADLVITGRVADPSMVLAPCIFEFQWTPDQYDRLAAGTIAGHLIECGTQVTGGVSTDWLTTPQAETIGFPIVEVSGDGQIVVTKAMAAGGRVSARTVKEQLLYEIGDPGCYLSPDVEVSFLNLSVEQESLNRVRVVGAAGRPAPSTYKVSATHTAGFRAIGQLTIFGADAVEKAHRCAEVIAARLDAVGLKPEQWLAETIQGTAAHTTFADPHLEAAVLRMGVSDSRREVAEQFSRELMPLVTAGPQGTTGYASGRPRVQEVFGYWPCLVDKTDVLARVELLDFPGS
jgi:hypothetical protein